MVLGTVIALSFLAALLVRPFLERPLVLNAAASERARRQFWLDLVLCLSAGVLASAFNILIFGFPIQSGLNLMSGVVTLGFFMGLDLSLHRERRVIIEAQIKNAPLTPPARKSPLSRTLTLVSLAVTACLAMILGLILGKDLTWLTQIEANTISLDEAWQSVTLEIFFVMAVLFVLIAQIILSYARNLNLMFANQTEVLERVSRGDFSSRVPVTAANEFGLIAAYTNSMIEGLKHRISLLGALKAAEDVQQNLLPKYPPAVLGLEIAAASQYSEETGGDYYDFIRRSDGRLVAAVGDVSGHGVGAAMVMASARSFLRMALEDDADLAEAANRVNERLSADIEETALFLTLFLIEIDPAQKRLTWVRAGHDPALLIDTLSGQAQELGGRGAALGLMDDYRFEVNSREGWRSGSLLALGTDGIWETRDESGRMLGKKRFLEIIRRNGHRPVGEILEAVFKEVSSFRAGGRQEDDVTLLVVRLQ